MRDTPVSVGFQLPVLFEPCHQHLSRPQELVKHSDFSENFRNKPGLEPRLKKSGKQPKQEVSGLKQVF
ncbi:hypothetical protein [Polaromonas sp. SM01]|uniref:hypothetical protein n=1 Tax=Polaromonas sp. SM01 TaxID=3085630 RepID=UPI00298233CA|nr:hypothetical protein [Polaromonas sp. SM01]MDW5443217.1 hypothetical protein [Polaromonas sp. SM01]